MEYPKPIMKMSELKEMGFPEEFLNVAYLSIMFDTAEFEKWRMNQLKTANRALRG